MAAFGQAVQKCFVRKSASVNKTGGTYAPGNEVGMKGSFYRKLMLLFCALAGCLVGYGISYLINAKEIEFENSTKDNTLVRELTDSVFFDRKEETQEKAGQVEKEVGEDISGQGNGTISSGTGPQIIPAASPTIEPAIVPSIGPELPLADIPQMLPTETEDEKSPSTGQPEELLPTIAPPDNTIAEEESGLLPSLAEVLSSQGYVWVEPTPGAGTLLPASMSAREETTDLAEQAEAAEVITYPVEIFGQVPVINRSDAYVSYFEFCYDLVTMLEEKVGQKGQSMNALLAKFAIRALFCGVDIEKLDINAPISRKEAALTLWLAAQILGEGGSNTSAYTAQNYVTDLNGCSGSEKKAVAYLYEQGILAGYQIAGQRFYPDAGLKTEAGAAWLSGANQCWK